MTANTQEEFDVILTSPEHIVATAIYNQILSNLDDKYFKQKGLSSNNDYYIHIKNGADNVLELKDIVFGCILTDLKLSDIKLKCIKYNIKRNNYNIVIEDISLHSILGNYKEITKLEFITSTQDVKDTYTNLF